MSLMGRSINAVRQFSSTTLRRGGGHGPPDDGIPPPGHVSFLYNCRDCVENIKKQEM